MGKYKYYVVRNGRHPGVYDTWEDCMREVYKYPDAEYYGYASLNVTLDNMQGYYCFRPRPYRCKINGVCTNFKTWEEVVAYLEQVRYGQIIAGTITDFLPTIIFY